jgi:hypothetical protein
MLLSQHTKQFVAAWVTANLLFLASFSHSAHAQEQKWSDETTNVIVEVKEADTGSPINGAHITLQFKLGKYRNRPGLSYNAKTNPQGRYKFTEINKGTIILSVTADGHQAYGQKLQLEKDNQVFEVKLKKPQPLI